jgi:hypothetical protein
MEEDHRQPQGAEHPPEPASVFPAHSRRPPLRGFFSILSHPPRKIHHEAGREGTHSRPGDPDKKPGGILGVFHKCRRRFPELCENRKNPLCRGPEAMSVVPQTAERRKEFQHVLLK